MATVKKIKANTPVNKKILREEEVVEEGMPSLAVKKKVATAHKVRQEMMKKK